MERVVEVSRGELERRRDAILARVGVTLDELTERAAAGSLVGDEWAAWDEISDIAYLLGD